MKRQAPSSNSASIAVGIDIGQLYVKAATAKKDAELFVKDTFVQIQNIVSFDDNNDLLIGRISKYNVTNLKDLLGKKFDNEYVQTFRRNTDLVVQQNDEDFVILPPSSTIIEPAYTPQYLITSLLKQLLSSLTHESQSETENPNPSQNQFNVVVTMDCDGSDEFVPALTNISKNSNIHMLRYVPVWEAALVAYGFGESNQKDDKYYRLIYDLSGDFLKIYLVLFHESRFTLSQSITIRSGTSLIDLKIVEKFSKQIALIEGSVDDRITKKWLKTADQLKRILSFQENVNLVFGDIGGICLSRTEFVDLIKDCNLIDPIQEILNKQNISKLDVKNVIMCGGGCNVYYVKEILQEFFGQEKILQTLEPTHVPAFGAAILAVKHQ